MFPINLVNIGTYIKYGAYAIVAIVIGLVAWNVKSTYSENVQLKSTVKLNDVSIATLQGDVKTEKDLNTALLLRKQQVDTIYKDRIVYVDKIKKGDTVYITQTEDAIAKAKQTTPDALDKAYYVRYNSILDCIQNVTNGKDDLCDTH